ncbi:zinc knuckle CX2CX4HX4C containing protein, partial [Tanacetum coccineum]
VTGPESAAFGQFGVLLSDGPFTTVSDSRIMKWQGSSIGFVDFAYTTSPTSFELSIWLTLFLGSETQISTSVGSYISRTQTITKNLADLNKRDVFKEGDKLLRSIATRMNKMTRRVIKEGKYVDILSTMSSADIDAAVNLSSSPKVGTSSPLVSPSTTIKVPRELNSIDVAATFGAPLTTVGDLHKLINDIKAGKHEELLSGMTNDDRMETLDALGSICNSIQANCNNLPSKASPSDPIVKSVDINTKSTSYAGAAGASTMAQPQVNSNFRPLVADPVFNSVNISIPRKVVKKGKHGLKRVMMNTKGFFFFKFESKVGLEVVLKSGPWMIRNTLIIIKKWSMSTSLLKEELTCIPIWVKLHNVLLQVFEEDGISLIATFIQKPIMLESYTSSMCKASWGRSSFAWCLIEVNSKADLVDSVTISIPSLTGDDFTKETIYVEYEWRPPRCDECKIFGYVHDHCPKKLVNPLIVTTSNVIAPTVEKSNDGFQTVGKKKKRKGKSKFTNDGQFTGPSVKQTVRYEPKATTIAPKKGATNVSNPSKSPSMLKTADTSPKNDNFTISNYFSILNDEEDDEEVKNVYDESANLVPNTNTTGSSSFMAAAGVSGPESAAFGALSEGPFTTVNDGRIMKWLGSVSIRCEEITMTLQSTTDGKMDGIEMVKFERIQSGSRRHAKTSLFKILSAYALFINCAEILHKPDLTADATGDCLRYNPLTNKYQVLLSPKANTAELLLNPSGNPNKIKRAISKWKFWVAVSVGFYPRGPLIVPQGAKTYTTTTTLKKMFLKMTMSINNNDATNANNNVVNTEDLPQLLDSRGGSPVTNVPQLDVEDFSSLSFDITQVSVLLSGLLGVDGPLVSRDGTCVLVPELSVRFTPNGAVLQTVSFSEEFFNKTSNQFCDGATDPDKGPICGRPLALSFQRSIGLLYIANAYFGFFVVGPTGGLATVSAVLSFLQVLINTTQPGFQPDSTGSTVVSGQFNIFSKYDLPTGVSGPESAAFGALSEGPFTTVNDGRIMKWLGSRIGFVDFAYTTSTRCEEITMTLQSTTDGKMDGIEMVKFERIQSGSRRHAKTSLSKKLCDGTTDPDLGPVCGRPLALSYQQSTNLLYIVDAYIGLLVVGPIGGLATQLVGGFKFLTGVDVNLKNGDVYFIDASLTYELRNTTQPGFTADATGRLLRYNPFNKQVSVLLSGLNGGGGPAVSSDGRFVMVPELTGKQISKYWLAGPKANTAELLLNPSGNPNKIKRAIIGGEFWVAVSVGFYPRGPLIVPQGAKTYTTTTMLKKMFLQMTMSINNNDATNANNNVVNTEDLPQLLDSRGGSPVTNVPQLDVEDFSSLSFDITPKANTAETFLNFVGNPNNIKRADWYGEFWMAVSVGYTPPTPLIEPQGVLFNSEWGRVANSVVF